MWASLVRVTVKYDRMRVRPALWGLCTVADRGLVSPEFWALSFAGKSATDV